MRPAWRLAISNLVRRRSRTILLVLVVALSAMLVSAVGTAVGSLRTAVQDRVMGSVGKGDLRVRARGAGNTLPLTLLDQLRATPDVTAVAPRLERPLSLRFGRPFWARVEGQPSGPFVRSVKVFHVTSRVTGIDPEADAAFRALPLVAGRLPQRDDEIVIDGTLVQRLSEANAAPMLGRLGLSLLARGSGASGKADTGPEQAEDASLAEKLNARSPPAVGDRIEVVRVGENPVTLTICGLASPPPLGAQPFAYMTIQGLGAASQSAGRATRFDVMLSEDVPRRTLEQFGTKLEKSLPSAALVQTSQRVTTGLDAGVRANQMGFVIINLMAVLAAGFIIATGLCTAVAERQRELAVLRCIGAGRRTLAFSQIITGGLIGLAGACVGVPPGVALAFAMLRFFHEQLQAHPVIVPESFVIPFVASILAGLAGALVPAWQASRVAPLRALTARAKLPSRRTLWILSIVGVLCVLAHAAILRAVSHPELLLTLYIALAMPLVMIGYFLLGVPGVLLASRTIAPLLERVLRVPRGLVTRSVRATPYRFGFTAGAMMTGLALLVGVWTQGGSALRDWIGSIKFPDGFAVGLNMSAEAVDATKAVPGVTDACPIALYPVETNAIGVSGILPVKTFFVAFEPESFFRMTALTWVQGDQASAAAALTRGGAVIVSKEFLAARGTGVGSTFTCKDLDGSAHTFDVVGVVQSPGLEMANTFFDVDEDFADQRVHSVFGSRKDLAEKFHSTAVGLIQFEIDETHNDTAVLAGVREALLPFGVLNAGSGRQVRELITGFMKTAFKIITAVAIFAMIVASFGVANLVIAGIQARRFEFGVMRAVGAMPGLLTRIILAEALVVGVVGCVLGTLLGLQAAFGGARLDEIIWGISGLRLRPPALPTLLGWGFVLVTCAAAAMPAAFALGKRPARELLASMRG